MTKVLVTGGAGFIGSHLCEKLLAKGYQVTAVDNMVTGAKRNLDSIEDHENFTFIEADVSLPTQEYLNQEETFDEIYHMASPASPRGYQDKPIETYKVNSFGTHYLCEYATKLGAVLLFASTSEVYGDPLEHPQTEEYRGNVSIRGIRACYDESKRFGEMVQTVWWREKKLAIKTVRIFNTYGPRMDPRDGRVFPNFINQALCNEPITIYGDGSQTRSFCYVSDLVDGLIGVMESTKTVGKVYNLGNPQEETIKGMAELIRKMAHSSSEFVYQDLPEDDPIKRKPDISRITQELGWKPKLSLEEGLAKTIQYFRELRDSN